jgi:hypothetical protein
MRVDSLQTTAGIDPRPALVARGGALRTFRGLALLLALVLFVLGAYMIADEFKNPLASQSFGLFTAAFLLASAMALIHELIQLPRVLWRNQSRTPIPRLVPKAARMQPPAPPKQNRDSEKTSKIGIPPPRLPAPTTKVVSAKGLTWPQTCGAQPPNLSSIRARDYLTRRSDLPYQRCYVDRIRVRA